MRRITTIIIVTILVYSCSKTKFLDAKPDFSLVVPKTLSDYQALLDEVNIMNGRGNGIVPATTEIGADNYFISGTNSFVSELKNPFYINLYTWNDRLYDDPSVRLNDWGLAYKSIFTSNVVIDGLKEFQVKDSEQEKFNNIMGSALFYRAHLFYQLLQVFANQYEKNSASNDLGIVLKLKSDISEKVSRVSIEQCYSQVIDDLNSAVDLLPIIPEFISRPSKPAVYGLLSRIYQTMGDYDQALQNANACLSLRDTLLDYNPPAIPNPNASFPLPTPQTNPEVIFYAILSRLNMEMLDTYYCRVDSNLLKTYSPDDLRSVLFFKDASSNGRPGDTGKFFRGSYDRSSRLFAGIATDEIYLIRAECYARKGDIANSMANLNKLLRKRWKKSATFQELTAATKEEAVQKVLLERRKELLFRGLRWTDLRRLNKDGANILITRVALGNIYTLAPNDFRYTYLIPKDVIDFNPEMEQNAR